MFTCDILELAEQSSDNNVRASESHLTGSSNSSCASAGSEHEEIAPVPIENQSQPTVPEPAQAQPAQQEEREPINLVLRMRYISVITNQQLANRHLKLEILSVN